MSDGEQTAVEEAYHAVIKMIFEVLYDELIHYSEADQPKIDLAVTRARKGIRKAEQTRELMLELVTKKWA